MAIVSDCCGASGRGNIEDYGICPQCGEHCEFVDEDEEDDDLVSGALGIVAAATLLDSLTDDGAKEDKYGLDDIGNDLFGGGSGGGGGAEGDF